MRKSTLSKVLIFAAGAAIGSGGTYIFVKKHFENIANEEIAEMRGYYTNKSEIIESHDDISEENTEDDEDDEVELPEQQDVPTMVEYSKIVAVNGYKDDKEKPYTISPDEFGEFDDYEQVSLTYYFDGYLADENNELVDDVAECVGWDSLESFGEYEDDSVHVRNDKTKTDYEIIKVLDRYQDVVYFE